MNLKVLMFPQLRATVPTLEARSGWCLQAAARRRQVTCSVPDVRFLWHRGRGHGHCGTSIATFRSEPLLTATVAQPSDLQQRPVVQSTGKHLLSLTTTRHTALFTCGWMITAADEAAIRMLPAAAWQAAVDQDGTVQKKTAVAEITPL